MRFNVRATLVLSTVTVILCSCYYPAQVVMHNRSASAKQVTIYTNGAVNAFPDASDSLTAYDHEKGRTAMTSRDYSRYATRLPLVKQNNSGNYSFLLPAGYRAVIHSSWPVASLPWGETFVVDGKDSVILRKNGKGFKRKGGSWTHIID